MCVARVCRCKGSAPRAASGSPRPSARAAPPYSHGRRSPWLECRRSSGWKVPNATHRAYMSSGRCSFREPRLGRALPVLRLAVEAADVIAHVWKPDVALLGAEPRLEREHRPRRARIAGELDRVAMLGENPGRRRSASSLVIGQRGAVRRADAWRTPATAIRAPVPRCAYRELIHVSAVRPGATALEASQHQSSQKKSMPSPSNG